jgi:Mn2+/Fe2+ NRAMP family transporter
MQKILNLLSKLGPGILFAGAAIGASHLVQSTRAGGNYGFSLLLLVIVANLLKYPFFEYGQRYTAATGESIIAGYARIGKPAVILFLLLNLITSFISAAGVTIVTAAIFKFIAIYIMGDIAESVSLTAISFIVCISIALTLLMGNYKLLDKSVKYMIISLAVFTLISFIVSLAGFVGSGSTIATESIYRSFVPFSGEIAAGFMIALVGWMPAPVEASSWSSLWALEKEKSEVKRIDLQQTLFDFRVGYYTTTVLACLFLSLGAFVLFGSGEEISGSAVGFIGQLIQLYTDSLGNWALPIISFVALITMVSTTLTVVDAYPRAIEETINQISPKSSRKYYKMLVIIISIGAVAIISLYQNRLTDLIDFVTTVSFIAAPVFGLLNIIAMQGKNVDLEYRPSIFLKTISYLGLAFTVSLAIWYLSV